MNKILLNTLKTKHNTSQLAKCNANIMSRYVVCHFSSKPDFNIVHQFNKLMRTKTYFFADVVHSNECPSIFYLY